MNDLDKYTCWTCGHSFGEHCRECGISDCICLMKNCTCNMFVSIAEMEEMSHEVDR